MAKKVKITPEYLKDNYPDAITEWNKLNSRKEGAKEKLWEDCASLTLPYLFPENNDESQSLKTPYNSVGPAAVNNLASKLTMALLPPTGSFFRLLPHRDKVEKLSTEEYQALDKELSAVEQDINLLIAAQQLTTNLYEAVRLLIVTGNALLHKIKGKSFKVFNPRFYCVDRDYVGNISTILIKETIDKKFLPKDFIDDDEDQKNEEYDIYTCIQKTSKKSKKGSWIAYQEVEGKIIPSTIVEYSDESNPYIVLRWTNIHNEDYGRGLVEQYKGDFQNLEDITRQIIEGTGIIAKTVFGIKPGKTTRAEDIRDAENGDIIVGDLENDVTTLSTNKSADFNVAYSVMQGIENRIGKAFLMFTSSIRDSERTTSAEVRATINELEGALGGTFAVLSQDLQIPLLKLLLSEIAPMANSLTEPTVISGNNAISREKDIQNMDFMLSKLSIFGPELLAQEINIQGLITEFGTALGLNTAKFLKTQEQKAQEQQQAMQQQQAIALQEQALSGQPQ